MQIIDINGKARDCVRAHLDPHWPGFVTIDYESKNRPGYKHTEWYPIPDFLSQNPNLAHLVKGVDITPAKDLAGIVTKCTSLTLTDKTQNWELNDYAGFYVWISRGVGEGQVRTVLSCTKNTLSLDKPWDKPLPNHTSQYVLSRQLGQATNSRGNTLPVAQMQALEKKARAIDLKRGVTPSPKQYTQ